jgi:hypothetical protein
MQGIVSIYAEYGYIRIHRKQLDHKLLAKATRIGVLSMKQQKIN